VKKQLTKHIKTTYLSKEIDENEKIVEYLVNGEQSVILTDSEIERMNRYFFCHDLISQKRSRHEVARKLQVKYEISRAQAYRDIYHMQYVIGSSISIDENYYEKFLIDSIIETIRMAAKKTDLKAKAAAERNLAMVLGFPKSDDNRITPDMLQQNMLIITSNIEALGLPKIKNLEAKITKYKRQAKKKPQFEDAEEV
jgi:hypothetical protein